MADSTPRPIVLADLGREPFRILFPSAVLAGILGAAVWPLHFAGWGGYPGLTHARLMAAGFFGGFIFGFLGTALPRMLSAPALGTRNVLLVTTLHLAMVLAYATGQLGLGDHLFMVLWRFFVWLMVLRVRQRKDTPPPGFVLAGLAFLCAGTGAVLAVLQHYFEDLDSSWVFLQRLLGYQGFVLLPILGVGPFLLPRFFGQRSPHDFPEMLIPNSAWLRKTALAFVVGLVIIGSFFLEVWGWQRPAYGIRLAAIAGYLFVEFPWRLAPGPGRGLGRALQVAFVALMGAWLILTLFPTYRAALLHLALIGGFAGVTLVVAAWVVHGHSGELDRLKRRHRWLTVTLVVFWVAMLTRISGDFWPAIMISHYIYAALLLIAGLLLWSVFVVPKTLRIDD
jgi:uncharacterized protein involved in response to NO